MVQLLREVVAAIVEAARAAVPQEACGILFGSPGPDPLLATVTRAATTRNSGAPSRTGHFRIDPSELRSARAPDGSAAIGYFHSHPNSRPLPSAEDLAGGWPGWVAVVVGLGDGGSAEVRAYRIAGDGAEIRWEPLSVLGAMAVGPGGE